MPFPGIPNSVLSSVGCDAEDRTALGKVGAICHNNDTNADEIPTDAFANEIKPPFLKGLYSDERVDEDGNTYVNSGRPKRFDGLRVERKGHVLLTAWVKTTSAAGQWKTENPTLFACRNSFCFEALTKSRGSGLSLRGRWAVTRDRAILDIVGDDFFNPPLLRYRENGGTKERIQIKNAGLRKCAGRTGDDLSKREEGFDEYKRRVRRALCLYGTIQFENFISVESNFRRKVFAHGEMPS